MYEILKSFDNLNNPVVPASFTYEFYINGITSSTVSLNISLYDSAKGSYMASFSAATLGIYQFSIKNITTSVIYISDLYDVRPESEINSSPTIYVGL